MTPDKSIPGSQEPRIDECPTCASDNPKENGPVGFTHHGFPHSTRCPKCCKDPWHAALHPESEESD